MALALRLEKLLATGVVKDFRTLARLGHVSPARISQIVQSVASGARHPPATTPDHRGRKVLADLERRRFKRSTALLLSGMAARSQVRFPGEKRTLGVPAPVTQSRRDRAHGAAFASQATTPL
jgi:hypothetical protein